LLPVQPRSCDKRLPSYVPLTRHRSSCHCESSRVPPAASQPNAGPLTSLDAPEGERKEYNQTERTWTIIADSFI